MEHIIYRYTIKIKDYVMLIIIQGRVTGVAHLHGEAKVSAAALCGLPQKSGLCYLAGALF